MKNYESVKDMLDNASNDAVFVACSENVARFLKLEESGKFKRTMHGYERIEV